VFAFWTLASSEEGSQELARPERNHFVEGSIRPRQSRGSTYQQLGQCPATRPLFSLKALKSDEAVRVISKVPPIVNATAGPVIDSHAGCQDPSALLKHELAHCPGQTKNAATLPILESVLAEEREDPMVRHEVSRCSFTYRRINVASCVHIAQAAGAMDSISSAPSFSVL
jgi:hypothetical protein